MELQGTEGVVGRRVHTTTRRVAATPSTTTEPGRISWWLGALLLVAAVVIPLLRQRGAHSWDTIWAEDGSIYSGQALHSGGFAVLLRGYAGYLQLPPRLVALVVPLVPFRDLALFLALAGTTINALLAWFFYRQSRGWIPSPLLRIALASSLVIGPVLIGENTANITNTIWTFAAVAPFALGSLQERPASVVGRAVVAFLAATSTALSFIYLPLAVAVALTRRTRATAIVISSFAVGLLVQGAVYLTSSQLPGPLHNQAEDLVEALGVRVFWFLMLGPRWTAQLWVAPLAFAVAGMVILLGAMVVVGWNAGRRAQGAAGIFTLTAVAMFVVTTWGRGTLFVHLAAGAVTSSTVFTRFCVIPIFLLLSAIAILLDDPQRAQASWLAVARVVLVVQIALLAAVNFTGTNGRGSLLPSARDAPAWNASVQAAWDASCNGEPSDNEVVVPLTQSFNVTVTCADIGP